MRSSQPGTGLVTTALLVAMVLGAFHALEPGHGKTVVAAYLVGSRGTARHALILGLIVTASHTAGVYLLGGVTFYASQHIVPEQLYPWLSLGSGLTIAVLGAVLFFRRYAGKDQEHGHHHGHHHHHGGLGHTHAHAHDHGPTSHAPITVTTTRPTTPRPRARSRPRPRAGHPTTTSRCRCARSSRWGSAAASSPAPPRWSCC